MLAIAPSSSLLRASMTNVALARAVVLKGGSRHPIWNGGSRSFCVRGCLNRWTWIKASVNRSRARKRMGFQCLLSVRYSGRSAFRPGWRKRAARIVTAAFLRLGGKDEGILVLKAWPGELVRWMSWREFTRRMQVTQP